MIRIIDNEGFRKRIDITKTLFVKSFRYIGTTTKAFRNTIWLNKDVLAIFDEMTIAYP